MDTMQVMPGGRVRMSARRLAKVEAQLLRLQAIKDGKR